MTRYFIGALDCVTTLIGISVNNEAKVGVVGKYFEEKEPGKYVWEPKCYFASADSPKLHYYDYEKKEYVEQKAVQTENQSKYFDKLLKEY